MTKQPKRRTTPPAGDGVIAEQIELTLHRAVEHCLMSQRHDGAWEATPDPRIFETALTAYALSCSPARDDAASVDRAKLWLARNVPQRHTGMAHFVESALRNLVFGLTDVIDLTGTELLSPVNVSRARLLFVLALHAGMPIDAPFDEGQLRCQVARSFDRSSSSLIKQWTRVEVTALHALLQARVGDADEVARARRTLEQAQADDGGFYFNPVSSALAYIALCQTAPSSTARTRCQGFLRRAQHPDGTWRFCTSDIWDTVLTLRSFRGHPRFDIVGLPRGAELLRQRQNPDGGWSFRSEVESDNDTTSAAVLALIGTSQGELTIGKALSQLQRLRRDDGLWRTWYFLDDPPVEDVNAHVVAALDQTHARHRMTTEPTKQWLRQRYDEQQGWRASWYHGVPYAVAEVSESLGVAEPRVQRALERLEQSQNPDGGWGPAPDSDSLPSSTGLALTALLRNRTLESPSVRQGLRFLLDTQRGDGTWPGAPEMYGPRPLLSHYQTHTQAFSTRGIIAAWQQMR